MKRDFERQIKSLGRLLVAFAFLLMFVIGGMLYVKNNPSALHSSDDYEILPTEETSLVELDAAKISESGFVSDPGVSQVIQNCTQCHSAKLVTQNRMSREGWQSTITWMQETQNLWDLGDKQEIIVGYLAKNYGPVSKGRRSTLTNVEWYELE